MVSFSRNGGGSLSFDAYDRIKKHCQIFVCVLVTHFIVFVSADYSHAQVPSEQEVAFLNDLRAVDLQISVQTGGNCIVDEKDLRAAVINRIIPAGLKLSDRSLSELRLIVLTIDRGETCATALTTVFGRFVAVEYPDENLLSVFLPVIQRRAVSIVGSAGYSRSMRSSIEQDIDYVLSRWREVNAGADFVRQAPVIPSTTGGDRGRVTPNIRTVQSRLQSLGFYNGSMDGTVGPASRQAIQNFQRSKQIPATGDLDIDTLRLLFP